MKERVKYVCQFCYETAVGEYEGFLSDVNILTCDRCGQGTHVHLAKPHDYAEQAKIRQAFRDVAKPREGDES